MGVTGAVCFSVGVPMLATVSLFSPACLLVAIIPPLPAASVVDAGRYGIDWEAFPASAFLIGLRATGERASGLHTSTSRDTILLSAAGICGIAFCV